jgi:hypothetical protein
MSEDTPLVVREADAIYESVRTINHLTIRDFVAPAPTVYGVLGNLKGATGDMLAQALTQLAAGLERSLDEYDVYEDDGRNPSESVASAAGHMRAAAGLAEQIGKHLADAQNAIAGQGYRQPED